MIALVFSYSAIATKIRAMYSRLLTNEDYEKMSSAGGVGEVVRMLKNSPGYANILAGVAETSVHREELEQILNVSIAEDVKKISFMLNAKQKLVLRSYLVRYEIAYLKQNVRRILYSSEMNDVSNVDSFPVVTKEFDAKAIAATGTIRELADELKDTPYGKIIDDYADREIKSAIDIETTLDSYYYSQLKQCVKENLSRADAKTVNKSLSEIIAITNIMWIYRYKKYYDMTTGEIINNVIADKEALSGNKIKELSELDLSEYYDKIKETKDVSEYKEKAYRKQLKHDSYSFNSIFAYLYLKETDIRNIITIVETVRYGVKKPIRW